MRLLLLALCLAVPLTARAQDKAAEPVEMRHMTWLEVRDRLAAGHTTVIVPTGGIEANGPHLTLDKHDHIVTFAAAAIARKLGKTLVAPVVSFVPEGSYDPPSGNMQWPGTIGLTDATFEGVLDGIARSLKSAGFRTIIFIGDHGQSQKPQGDVAARLTREWRAASVRVAHIGSYYDDSAQIALLESLGETRATIGTHAGLQETSELSHINPQALRLDRLKDLKKPLAELGGSGEPHKANAALGEKLIGLRIDAAIAEINRVLGPR